MPKYLDYDGLKEYTNKLKIVLQNMGSVDNSNLVNGEGTGSLIQTNTVSSSGTKYTNTASGAAAIALGKNVKATGNTAFTIGQTNENSGNAAFVSGRSNTNKSDNVVIGGAENTNNEWSPFAAVFGNKNTAVGNNSGIVAGEGNNVSYGYRSLVIGEGNKLVESHNKIVAGQYNNPNKDALIEIGQGSSDTDRKNIFEVLKDGRVKLSGTPTDSDDVVVKSITDDLNKKIDDIEIIKSVNLEGNWLGSIYLKQVDSNFPGASVGGNMNIALGKKSYSNGGYAISEGDGTNATNWASHTAGWNTKTGASYQFSIGSANEGKSNTYFEVGNGTSDTNRKNAFEVLCDGRAKVQSAPTDDDDVVRKADLPKIYRHDIYFTVTSYVNVYSVNNSKQSSIPTGFPTSYYATFYSDSPTGYGTQALPVTYLPICGGEPSYAIFNGGVYVAGNYFGDLIAGVVTGRTWLSPNAFYTAYFTNINYFSDTVTEL